MHCFSYGSNMSLARLLDRVPSAVFVAVATLPGHRLRFHKVSIDGSGKCDAEYTGNPDDRVIGVVYEISRAHKPALDRKEGLGAGYDEKAVEVTTLEGKKLNPVMYYATRTDSLRKPYHWYKAHVLAGARENNLSTRYVVQIEETESIDDPDSERDARESAIHC